MAKRVKGTKFSKYTISMPALHWTIEVVFTIDPVGYAASIGGMNPQSQRTSTINAVTMYFDTTMKHVIVFQPDASDGTVAHECWHCVHRMFEHLGIRLDDGEAVAYHLGYIVQCVSDARREVNKGRKKCN